MISCFSVSAISLNLFIIIHFKLSGTFEKHLNLHLQSGPVERAGTKVPDEFLNSAPEAFFLLNMLLFHSDVFLTRFLPLFFIILGKGSTVVVFMHHFVMKGQLDDESHCVKC